jgi:hypothetical protein
VLHHLNAIDRYDTAMEALKEEKIDVVSGVEDGSEVELRTLR